MATVTPVELTSSRDTGSHSSISDDRRARLQQAIEAAAHLLPAQGPITVFIHHNTLHAFEELPFTEAVKRGGKLNGCQPYLAEERYRQELRRGRIRLADLESVLRDELRLQAEQIICGNCSRLQLRLAMLQHPLQSGSADELRWFVAETDALRRVLGDASNGIRSRFIAETRHWVMRDLRGRRESALASIIQRFDESKVERWSDRTWEALSLQALWRICCDGVAQTPHLTLLPALPTRHRDLLLLATGQDSDRLVHDVLIRWCGAFLDQGLAHWQLPDRERGLFHALPSVYGSACGPPEVWISGFRAELKRLAREGVEALESIADSLAALGIDENEWEDAVAGLLLPLRGWAGMIRFLEERPDRALRPVPHGSLIDFLAVRLILERLALAHVARQSIGFRRPLHDLRGELRKQIGKAPLSSIEQRAFAVFQLAQVLGWTPEELHRLSSCEWAALMEEIEMFAPVERRRVFHLAYERRSYSQTLDALTLHARAGAAQTPAPRLQVLFCIDERQESLRRHLEELAPDAETFGIAGFYFLDMYYRGAADAHFVPLCPPVMRPGHWVVEEAEAGFQTAHERQARRRRALGLASHSFHIGSRRFAIGALLSAALGVLATAPLIARTLFPRFTARLRTALGRMVAAPPVTRLCLERREREPGPENGHVGYTLEEMTTVAERVLRDTGLTRDFAPLVLTLGHGSTSMNNPHESAHDCGACGGSRGGPNGRAIARLLNDDRVRQRLRERGIDIPSETIFVGGMHNTSNETIDFYDLDLLPDSHRQAFAAARSLMEQACDRDAHERCRRFESAPLTLANVVARQHVEGRAEDLAQVRPEWGHATNAICIVGRRQRTRGLFLDRRAFLNSYDPTQDDAESSILARILSAAGPVCAGISLEYYFSYVDNVGYGCGTKLPHNITGLLGVMDGAASDLRTGLPWQMVEIHEPVRILFVIETAPARLLSVLDRNPVLNRLVKNEWIRVATLDPDSPAIHVYRGGRFEPYQSEATELPRANSSVDWYRGWRDHLAFAEIGPMK